MKRRIFQLKSLLLVLALGLCLGWSDQQEKDKDPAGPIAASPEQIRPLLIGAKAPDLTLKTIEGEPFDLNAAITKKPTVLIFYRGGW